ncbi:MAG TPA: fasciclin domain-containing protein [Phycisphaerales bacterium]|nr:fasciclin domain-containing protein [Phycisphaerales bacterium]
MLKLSCLVVVALAGSVAGAQCSEKSYPKSDCGEKNTHAQVTHASYDNKASKDIVDTAIGAGSFKTLVAAVQAAGLVDALKGPGPFTVFAPSDEAFAKLPAGTVTELLKPENKQKLANILKYHVVSGKVLAADVKTSSVATLAGQRVDLKAGKGVMVDGATVVTADVLASNGVIHVIDTVIMPSDKNIVETAVAAGSFKTLARLLEQAELVGALTGEGPFTVFAPTDEAFAKLPKETVESLLKPENKDKLAAILKLHVIQGRVFSDTAAKGATVKTLNGQEVTTKSEAGKVLVGNATVTTADLDTSNGVIHVIDTVLLPK